MTHALLLTVAVGLALACQQQPAGDTPDAATPAPAPPTPPAASPSMPNPGVEITLDRSTYRSRGDVSLTVTSRSARDLGYNACTRIVEREVNGAWTAVPEPDRVCTMELRLLSAGQTVKEQTDLPAVAAGRYRMALMFSDVGASAGGPVRAVSAPFTIQ